MKKKSIILIFLMLISKVFAQSSFEKELVRLTEDRDQSLARASDPIQRKYKTLLEELLKRAMANQDLDAMVKIKEAIARIPASNLASKTKPKTAQELRGFLDGTTWNISDKSPSGAVLYTLTFQKNGTFKHSDGRTGKYDVLTASDFKIWGTDPAILNEEFNQFRAVGVGAATIYFGNLRRE